MKTKKCSICDWELPLDSFNFKNKVNGTRQVRCRSCGSDYNREHYRRNPQPYKDRAKVRTKLQQFEYRKRIYEYLLAHPCVDCGECDPVCLEFDHVKEGKQFNIGNMISSRASWSLIETEISLCVVRCANCHRKRTAKQFKWYKSIISGIEKG